MACLKNNGTELLRIDRITDRISVRSNGRLLRDYGTGWKRWRHCPLGTNPYDYAESLRKQIEVRSQEVSAFQVYKRAIIAAFPRLAQRARVHHIFKRTACASLDAVMRDFPFDPPSRKLVEPLIPLFLNALDEKIETKLNDL